MASNSKISKSKYYLVLFLGNNKNRQEVDIVPASWMFHNNSKDEVRCKFMPGPYDKAKQKELKLIVKNCVGPNESWPDYAVEIRGRADSYEQAEKRLRILKSESYAFTTDNEKSAKSQALINEKLFKIKTTNNNAKLKSKLNSANLKFNTTESPRNKICNSGSSRSSESSVENDSKSTTTLSQKLKRKTKSPKKDSSKRQKLNNSKSSCAKKCAFESLSSLESSASSNASSQAEPTKKLSKQANLLKELQREKESASKSSESSFGSDSPTRKERLKKLRQKIRARQGKSRSDNSKLNDSGCSNRNNYDSFHDDYSQGKTWDKADLKTSSGSNICKSSALEKISSSQNIISSTPKTSNKLNKNTAERGSSKYEIIKKYFVSLSKQIGQLTSLSVQHSAELNNIYGELKDLKKLLKKKCSCDGGQDRSSGESCQDDDNEESEEPKSAGETKKYDYPINEKEEFEEFNKQLNDKPHERKIVIKRIHQLVNANENLNSNMKLVIRAYITRNIVISYVPSAAKLNKKKPIFKNTAFYKCIEEVIRLKLTGRSGNAVTDSEMLKAMATVLRNARD